MIELKPLLIAMAGGLAAWIAVEVAQRILTYFWSRRVLRQVIDRVKHPENYANEASAKSQFIVRLSESRVECERPDGEVEAVCWDDLQQVELLNTDEGPWLPDVFWVLHGTHGGCVIPWGATGGSELMERLQRLPDFDNAVILDGAASTRNETRVCWTRKKPPSRK
jgi:hypothetical protein